MFGCLGKASTTTGPVTALRTEFLWAGIVAAGLALFSGACGHKTAEPEPTAGISSWRTTTARPVPAFTGRRPRAALDAGAVVALHEGAKFDFADVPEGPHPLHLYCEGARFKAGGRHWSMALTVGAGSQSTVEIRCGDNGAVDPAWVAKP